MSALARNQIRLPVRFALATSVPVPVVFQLPSIVRPLTITTRLRPLSRLIPIHAEESRSIASPLRSPSRIEVTSRATVAVDDGPCIRWVSVLRALYRSLVTVAVESFKPLLTLYFVVSGLWFHSHCGPSAVPANVSTPVIGLTWRGGGGRFGIG